MRPLLALLAACLLPAVATPARAADIEPLQGRLPAVAGTAPILTLTVAGRAVPLGLAAIERLPLKQSTLKTDFGLAGTFQGVLLSDLLAAYGLAHADRIGVKAADDYAISLKPAEIAAGAPLLATRLDGRPFTDPSKGPLLLLWPSQEQDLLAGRIAGTEWVWSVVAISGTPR